MNDGFFTAAEIDAVDKAWATVSPNGIGEGDDAFPIEAKHDVAALLDGAAIRD